MNKTFLIVETGSGITNGLKKRKKERNGHYGSDQLLKVSSITFLPLEHFIITTISMQDFD